MRRYPEESIFVPLPIGAVVGACAFEAELVIEGVSFQWVGIPLMAFTGLIFGLVPYFLVAIPSCLLMERLRFHPALKIVFLTLGGLGMGFVLGSPAAWAPNYAISVWAIATAGSSGLMLGLLRR
jgi:hypothetical protein